MIDKYYFIKGGAERYYFELKDVLEANGHTVAPFSMQHPENFPTKYEPLFVKNVDYNAYGGLTGKIRGLADAVKMIYSVEAKKRLGKLLEEFRPDVAHLHMIDHQLSPSILHTLSKHSIPTLQTVHQYKLVCPNYRLYHPTRGEICELCLNGSKWSAIKVKCHKDSLIASGLIALESAVHRRMRIYEKHMHLYHAPSHFMAAKLAEGGVAKRRIDHLFYTIKTKDYPFAPDWGNYFAYVGRLSEEKGVFTLLSAVKGGQLPKLKIIGDGPIRPALEAFAREQGLENVEFMGNQSGDALKQLVSGAMFIVVPSEWYENSPLVVYEAFSFGKPVVGAALGGIPELVADGERGLLFQAGNVEELREKLEQMAGYPRKLRDMGLRCRSWAERKISPEAHYPKIMALYDRVISEHGQPNG